MARETGNNGNGTWDWDLMNYVHQSSSNPAWGNFDLTPINSVDLYVAGP